MKLKPLMALSLTGVFVLSACGEDADTGAEADDDAADESTTETESEEAPSGQLEIRGSDTMVNLGQAFAETYMSEANEAAGLSVTGGGSGTGIAALINDDVDLAQSSRLMADEEIQEASDNNVDVHRFIVGRDGLGVATHPENPVDELTVDELKDIFVGEVTSWDELGWEDGGDISLYSRQSNSGTYVYFNENIMDGEDFGSGAQYMSGSSAIQEAVAQDESAIGYIGIGYFDDSINAVDIAADEDSDYYTPLEEENVNSGDYPIARPLNFYTNGVPDGLLEHYLTWVTQDERAGDVLMDTGFYHLTDDDEEQNEEKFSELGLNE
ncbi:phosphate ABC transporter substrate-binding protein (PhoT family) [Salsuginibacillus halophilus]|uniref:Phosphate-binding protein n=1 Tax=Salsuginibacillus halophilus TaxID=517424 RepID=A0A2P8H3Q4_9BACI|nr:PstS family phosphate ABC transporter substrate-binding protein [Salsuginibacillus halophilus]PSL40847.1 phosphate ABC transporter substrate-binding protein (PhoT family) [Salsuginibacillus halophilus]